MIGIVLVCVTCLTTLFGNKLAKVCHQISAKNKVMRLRYGYETAYIGCSKWGSIETGTISAKCPWNTHSIKALNMLIINFPSTMKNYHPLPP